MKTFRIPEPEWAQAMFNRLKTMISNLKSNIDGAGYITQESDPTVPAWAKAANKPTYTASEVGAVSTSDVANNLTTTAAGKVLDARQGKVLKDLIDSLTIPTKTSELTNDSGFLSGNDVANDLTTTTAGKVLDARQGKALKDLIDAISVPTQTSDLTNDGDGTNNNSPFATQAYVLANGSKGLVDIDYGGQYISDIYPYLNSKITDHEIRLFTANILRMNLLTNARINVPAWGLLYRYDDIHSAGDVYYTMICFEEYSGNGCYYARVYSNPTDWANEVVHVEAAYEFGKTAL